MLASVAAPPPRGDDAAWAAAYSDVSGTLPLADLPRSAPGGSAMARCDIAVTAGGNLKLLLNSTDGLEIEIDGKPARAAKETVLRLDSGLHALTFRIEASKRKEGLRCQLGDVPGSTALAQFVGGK